MKKAKEQVDIERLVTWALLDQGLGWSTGQSSGGNLMTLGTRIDTSGISTPSVSLQSDDDALLVRAGIDAMAPDVAELIIRHGRIGQRPDWCEEGVGDFVQKKSANGKLAWVFEKPGDYRSPRKPVMEFIGWRKEQVEYFRATYRLWWVGLQDLATHLNTVMATHEATGPKAPFEPWLEEKPVIHTPDGPLESREKPRKRGTREYVEIEGKMVRRA
ncbi:hypothetical protein V6617_10185 [Pelagibacterium nitratireducens]|uniref:Uncharacterized protein n=1 Tax=Pelagibacterium nitratireducens TaxID=1046114 RepID=A0ABZ2HZF7_9HYPH